ncbi:MAG: MATE family efflux transporter [Eubacteriales bacterium]|nr:MATE family efflux transporter [Eubacteriales bacterium]
MLSNKNKENTLKHDFTRYVTATIASLLVFSLYAMVDGLIVSIGVNEYAMSAVNIAIPFINALFSIGILFAVGSSTVIAILLAQDKKKEADYLFSQNFVTLLVIGGVITTFVLVFREPFARLLGADEVTLNYVTSYLLGIAPFSVCYLISYNMEVLVKTDGHPRYALYTVIGGCLTNCILDYIAVFVLKMGVFGAALATGISQLVTCISYLIHFFSKNCTFRLRRFKFDPGLYKRIIPIGLADGTTELCTGLMIFLFNRTVLKYIGTDGVVTYTVIAYINTLVVQIMIGIPQGSQPLISFNHGKGAIKECHTLLRYALTTVCFMAPAIFAGLFIFAPWIVQAYLSHASEELVLYSVKAFRCFSFSFLLVGFNIITAGFMTAIERPTPAIGISVGRGLILQGSVLLIIAAAFGGNAVWFTPIVSEALCLIMSVLCLRKYLRETHQ